MLDKFKKLLGVAPVVEAVAEAAEASTETSTVVLNLDASVIQTELSVMRIAAETHIAALAEMTAKFEAAHAALNALAAEKAELAAQAAVAKFAARKEKVVLAIGASEKSEALMLATQDLNDASFDAVVKALAGSVDAEASSSLFTEVGVSATADTTKIVEESSVMKLINKKNNKTK